MPIFEYKCAKCGSEFEEIVLDNGDAPVVCPDCGSDKTDKLISRCKYRHGGFGPGFADDPSSGSSGGCAGCTGGDCSSCG